MLLICWFGVEHLAVPQKKTESCNGNLFPSSGSVEKKQQRRSIRTRSESEKSTEAVPKKKIKKEQVGFLHVES